jgi:hypothetical protein
MGGVAAQTDNLIRDLRRVPAGLHRTKGLTVKGLMFFKVGSSLPSLFFTGRRLGQRWQRVNGEVSVVRMLLFEVVLRFHVGVAVQEDIGQTKNDLFDLSFGELGADPNDEPRDFRH